MRKRARWKVWVNDANGGIISYECRHLVLATGSSDKAGVLNVPGESFSFVTHNLRHFEEQLSRKSEKGNNYYKKMMKNREFSCESSLSRCDNKIISQKSKSNGYIQTTGLNESEKTSGNSNRNNGLNHTDDAFGRKTNSSPHVGGGIAEGGDGVGGGGGGGKKLTNNKQLKNNTNGHVEDTSSISLKKNNRVKTTEGKGEEEESESETETESIIVPADIPKNDNVDISLSEMNLENDNDKDKIVVDVVDDDDDDDDNNRKVLIVGAGLSASDAILAAWKKNYDVIHAFRSPLTTTKLPAVIYPEYHEVN